MLTPLVKKTKITYNIVGICEIIYTEKRQDIGDGRMINSDDGFDFANGVLYLKEENAVDYIVDENGDIFTTRDPIFKGILKNLEPAPIKVFQVGAIETFEGLRWRCFSGWSDMLWGEYIREHGGGLTVVDININHLAHSTLAAAQLGYEINAIYGDAADHITAQDYDIYYLDGSNDPHETLDQYNKIKHTSSIIIIDDYSIKGTLVDKIKPQNTVVYDIFSGIAVIDLRSQ